MSGIAIIGLCNLIVGYDIFLVVATSFGFGVGFVFIPGHNGLGCNLMFGLPLASTQTHCVSQSKSLQQH